MNQHRRRVRGPAAPVIIAVGAMLAAALVLDPVSPAGAADPAPFTMVANNVRQPEAMVAGPDGNLWFVNRGSDSIGRVTPAGAFTFFSDPKIRAPRAIAIGPDGNVWFGNDTHLGYGQGSIGRMTTAGVVTVFPNPGRPTSMTAGPDGRLWFTNDENTVGAVTMTGVVSTYGDPVPLFEDPRDITAGPDGNLWVADFGAPGNEGRIARISPTGVLLPDTLGARYPTAITTGADGSILYTNAATANVASPSIVRVTPANVITSFPISGNQAVDLVGTADGSIWFSPADYPKTNQLGHITAAGVVSFVPVPPRTRFVAAGPDGNIWFTSPLDHVVGRVTPAGAVTTFADPRVSGPTRLTVGPDGNLWYTNQRGNTIGRIAPAGATTTFSGPGVIAPFDITPGPDGNLWFTNLASIGRITPTGVVTKFAGPNIGAPVEITAGPDGNPWFTDPSRHAVGRITPAGVVDTFTSADLQSPTGITANRDGNLWFTDFKANSISRITPVGVITTIADRGDGPQAIVAGPDGVLYYANAGTILLGSVRRLLPNGDEEVIGGGTYDDRVAATDLTIDGDGTLWLNDGSLNRIASIDTTALTGGPAPPLTTVIPFTTPYASSGGGGLAIGPDGHLWFTLRNADAIGFTGTGLIPAAGPPAAPTGVTATAGVGAAVVTWTAPDDDGGSPITGYTVTASPGAGTCGWTSGPLTCAVTGLDNGTPYTFTVTASNGVATGPASAPSPPATPQFADLAPGAPFLDDINWLAAAGITNGYPDGGFHPTAPVTRQSMAAFLYRFSGRPDGPAPVCSTAAFTDVPVGAPFCGEIHWLATAGFAGGYPDGGFHPTAPVSRQAMAAFLYRVAGAPDGADPPCLAAPFPDIPTDHPFCGEIAWLVDHDIAAGYPDGGFHPTAAVSRQATAAFLHRLDGVLHA